MNVGARIIAVRNQKHISGNKLAILSGISQSTINRIERGEQFPTTETMEQICDALGITLSEFFAEDDELSPDLRKLLDAAKDLNPVQRANLTQFIQSMKGNDSPDR